MAGLFLFTVLGESQPPLFPAQASGSQGDGMMNPSRLRRVNSKRKLCVFLVQRSPPNGDFKKDLSETACGAILSLSSFLRLLKN